MAYVVIAYAVIAYVVMAYASYGMCSYKVCFYGLYSYDLWYAVAPTESAGRMGLPSLLGALSREYGLHATLPACSDRGEGGNFQAATVVLHGAQAAHVAQERRRHVDRRRPRPRADGARHGTARRDAPVKADWILRRSGPVPP